MDIITANHTAANQIAARQAGRVLFISDIDARLNLPQGRSYQHTNRQMGRNTGNLLFTHAIQSYLARAGIEYDIVSPPRERALDIDFGRYSHCIINVANWLSVELKDYLVRFAMSLSEASIPIYCVGLGAQAERGDEPTFVERIRREASVFIDTVLKSGGAIGLRGQFTADCFDVLGYSGEYTVTGCPSMFQFHSSLQIEKPALEPSELKPLLNGMKQLRDTELVRDFRGYYGATYVCQDTLMRFLAFYSELERKNRLDLLAWPEDVLEIIRNRQARIFFTLSEWISFIRREQFNYSFGGRIHGNIAAILSGVPATVSVIDSRTRELADFFQIPTSQRSPWQAGDTLFAEYEQADFEPFNKRFTSARQNFADFIERHGIPFELPTNTNPIGYAFLNEAGGKGGGASDPPEADRLDSDLIELVDRYRDFEPVTIIECILDRRAQFGIFSRLSGHA
ncbi:polysaccharide pyruvyl transferase family protein [Aurantiacibacter rhizosphaerae]|uniref:Polysaccharide pyruvyl transferase domain-containing protein n=1 Tax=Aurantiacibacter rhizosphaerae TaxID=2691582 RepID=A0A844XB80_9SPHN|nr:polysaccharide pyruvyl transferase family protein [Aurantiacibacter rhizosphaerae]MWV26972.1 hypothetical protein [Aurantiacibacter rhizosphaerae]